jgi:hypothetical protein
MIKLFAEEEQPILFQIVDEIHEMLMEQCPKYNEYHETIHITTLEEMRPHMGILAPALENGFGYSISDHPRNGIKIRIIVINTEKCTDAGIIPNEYKALILHELGHLLNWLEPVPVPNHYYCLVNKITYSLKAHTEAQNLNSVNNEIYADYYSKQFGYEEALIGLFDKHILHFEEPFKFYDIRVESIENEEEYNGFVKPIQ